MSLEGGSEGALSLTLSLDADVVSAVRVASTRPPPVSRLFEGRPLDQALALVPALFSICRTAQHVAAVEAAEAALGVKICDEERLARRALVLLEQLDHHAWQFDLEWPARLGLPPKAERLRAWRALTETARRALGAKILLGGAARPHVTLPLAALEEALDARLRDPFFDAFLARCAEFSSPDAPRLLPTQPAAFFEAALDVPSFSARPTFDGAPAEVGALARQADARLIALGPLLARATARKREAFASLTALKECAQELREGGQPVLPARDTGLGTAVVETARGPLAHRLNIAEGRVISWRSVAPTEWTFHPDGVLQQLRGLTALKVQERAEMWVTLLDPCVPCRVDLEGPRHA